MIDFHNHLVPGVDDGAADLEASRAALEAYAAQGVSAVVTTPHLRGSETLPAARREEALAALDLGWERLDALARADFPAIRVERAVELMLDVPVPDLSDPRVRLAGTRFVLVEFPYMTVPPNAGQVLFDLSMAGWTPVLAHPERYSGAEPLVDHAAEWKRRGALLQVNCGSLLGRYGPEASRAAWGLLKQGLADYLCSDYHARGTLHLAGCRAELERRGHAAQAALLLDRNPALLLEGAAPEPVPPIADSRGGFLKRIFGGR
jgi:protein-tyrosine phosphatase